MTLGHDIINLYDLGPPRRLITFIISGPPNAYKFRSFKEIHNYKISGSSRIIIIFASYRSIKSHRPGPRSPIKMLTIAPSQSKLYCIEGHIKSKVIPIFHRN